MPYLNITDPDNFTHLIQLFLAAHPAYQQPHERIRAQGGDPQAHWLSTPMIQDMVVWGRERHIIRRKDAARLLEVAEQVFKPPAEVVTLTPRVMGMPPRLQPTVLSTEIYTWLYLADADMKPGGQEYVFTVAAALTLLENIVQDGAEPESVRVRAHELRQWLAAQDTPAATDAD